MFKGKVLYLGILSIWAGQKKKIFMFKLFIANESIVFIIKDDTVGQQPNFTKNETAAMLS